MTAQIAPARSAWHASFAPLLAELRTGLRARRPEQLAALAGIAWDDRAQLFHLRWLQRDYCICSPELVCYAVGEAVPSPANVQGLVLSYLAKADGIPATGKWIAFRELPDGWLYHRAFQGYTGVALVQQLGNDVIAFSRAAETLGGRILSLGDCSYGFTMLPRIRLALVYWLGDDEFGPGAQVLFDQAASHYLSTDGLAILGRDLVGKLLNHLTSKGAERP